MFTVWLCQKLYNVGEINYQFFISLTGIYFYHFVADPLSRRSLISIMMKCFSLLLLIVHASLFVSSQQNASNHTLYLGVFLSMNSSVRSTTGFLPALDIAIETVNNHTEVLKNLNGTSYTLNMVLNDSRVSCLLNLPWGFLCSESRAILHYIWVVVLTFGSVMHPLVWEGLLIRSFLSQLR